MHRFLLGVVLGAVMGATTLVAAPVLFGLRLVGTDAAGRTFVARAQGLSLLYSGGPTYATSYVEVHYTTDQLLCSGFGE